MLDPVLHDRLQQLLAQVANGGGDAVALLDDAIQASRSLSVELTPLLLHAAGFVSAQEWLAL